MLLEHPNINGQNNNRNSGQNKYATIWMCKQDISKPLLLYMKKSTGKGRWGAFKGGTKVQRTLCYKRKINKWDQLDTSKQPNWTINIRTLGKRKVDSMWCPKLSDFSIHTITHLGWPKGSPTFLYTFSTWF